MSGPRLPVAALLLALACPSGNSTVVVAEDAFQPSQAYQALPFIPTGMLSRKSAGEWVKVAENNKVTLEGETYELRPIGKRYYLVSKAPAGAKREVRLVKEDGSQYVSVIRAVKQGNHRIVIRDVVGGALLGSDVPTSIAMDASGDVHMEIMLKDVTFVRAVDRPMPIAIDYEEDSLVYWVKGDVLPGTKDSGQLYFDEYGSFYNDRNCYDDQQKSGPVFLAIALPPRPGQESQGKKDLVKLSVLVKDGEGNVVPKNVPLPKKTDSPQAATPPPSPNAPEPPAPRPNAQGALAQPPGEANPPPVPRRVEGWVQAVSEGGSVEVTISSDERAKEGDRLVVFRVDDGGSVAYLGQIEVVRTTPQCLGRIVPGLQKGAIKKYDRVVLREAALGEDKAPGPTPKVEARVTAVFGKLVQISAGSDEGIAKGHRFDVVRTNDGTAPLYLGEIEVIDVRALESVCKIIPDHQKGPIEKGDHVVAKGEHAQ